MRLISYRSGNQPGVGVMVDHSRFISLRRLLPDLPPSLKEIIEQGGAVKRIAEAIKGNEGDLKLEQVQLDPVIPEPHATWALALNFQGHIQETGLTTSPDYPQIFMRMPISVVGHNETLWCPNPAIAKTFDYEGELAVVIGTPGRHIPIGRALSHVAGYACYNEGSVREFQGHNRQFGLGKNFERSGSFGPWLMTPDEFGDPKTHRVITRLNGVEKQNQSLEQMMFSVEQVIHYLSTGYTLQCGDVIAMGTPGALKPPPGYVAGANDSPRIPGRTHMKPGDICEVELTGYGVLSNPIVADPTPLEP
ncbi:MAG TPA: fumarylacetoacetate hydrolase family protein [Stellaceae bacterium]|jgi:2-keto-4-pentenoate hydratase/2-oxohepta-3-ene-1,7-dioic acid hydratase in catechol pathway|nr:fumarylacetoacetate hydrolase family protein [Stellaceae bacterium]